METLEQIEYLASNLSGATPESRSLISQLEIAREFIGFGGVWQSAPLPPLNDRERRLFFDTPKEIIAWYGTDTAQELLDSDFKFSTQLCHDGRWATTIQKKTAEDYQRDAEIDGGVR
jgi:hypothetical protein